MTKHSRSRSRSARPLGCSVPRPRTRPATSRAPAPASRTGARPREPRSRPPGSRVEAWVVPQLDNSGGYQAVLRKNAAVVQRVLQPAADLRQPAMAVKTQANGTTGPTANSVPSTPGITSPAPSTTRPAGFIMDGVLIAPADGDLTGPILNTGGALKIAAGDSEPWSGHLDCIRLWSVARTQQQIQTTMQYQVASAPGLVSSWHLDNNLLDSTGANHGTMVGRRHVRSGRAALPIPRRACRLSGRVAARLPDQPPVRGLPYVLDISSPAVRPASRSPRASSSAQPSLAQLGDGRVPHEPLRELLRHTERAGHAIQFPYVNVPYIPALVGDL